MGVEIIAQQGIVTCGISLGVSGQPALGGVDLAVLFDLAVLRPNELRAQRHHLRMAGADDDRRDGAMLMSDLAFSMPEAAAAASVKS